MRRWPTISHWMSTLVSTSTCMSYTPKPLGYSFTRPRSRLQRGLLGNACTDTPEAGRLCSSRHTIHSVPISAKNLYYIDGSFDGRNRCNSTAHSRRSQAPIRAVITMSTPALLSPVRFDRRMKDVYTSIRNTQLGRLRSDQAQIPLVAICGGATDPQVGSEACAISFNKAPYRRTVYTTSAEGVWTGVDHLAMVWCHQVRSLVARAALELANTPPQNTVTTLQKWLMVDATQVKHDPHLIDLTNMKPVYVPIDGRLRISEPSAGLHLLPIPPPTEELASGAHRFTLFVSGGNVYNHRSENLPE
jgi:hypothetical protein